MLIIHIFFLINHYKQKLRKETLINLAIETSYLLQPFLYWEIGIEIY